MHRKTELKLVIIPHRVCACSMNSKFSVLCSSTSPAPTNTHTETHTYTHTHTTQEKAEKVLGWRKEEGPQIQGNSRSAAAALAQIGEGGDYISEDRGPQRWGHEQTAEARRIQRTTPVQPQSQHTHL